MIETALHVVSCIDIQFAPRFSPIKALFPPCMVLEWLLLSHSLTDM